MRVRARKYFLKRYLRVTEKVFTAPARVTECKMQMLRFFLSVAVKMSSFTCFWGRSVYIITIIIVIIIIIVFIIIHHHEDAIFCVLCRTINLSSGTMWCLFNQEFMADDLLLWAGSPEKGWKKWKYAPTLSLAEACIQEIWYQRCPSCYL